MSYIIVNAEPSDNHPEAMRKAWLGLALPLMTKAEYAEIQKLTLVNFELIDEAHCVLTEKAVAILDEAGKKEAADYYRAKAEENHHSKVLIFDKACCTKKYIGEVSLMSAINVYNNPSFLYISLLGDAGKNSKLFGFTVEKFLEDRDRMRGIVSVDPKLSSAEEACDAVKEFLELCLWTVSRQSNKKGEEDLPDQLINSVLKDKDSVPYDAIFVLTQDRVDEMVSRLREDYCVYTYSGTLKTFPFEYKFEEYLKLSSEEKMIVNGHATQKNQLFINKYFSENPTNDWLIVGDHPHTVIASGNSSNIPGEEDLKQKIQENKKTCFLYRRPLV